MELFPLCLLGLVLFAVLLAAVKAIARSYHVRPERDEVVQMTWRERESLERQNINGEFWRFVAKLEFFLLVGAAVWILILQSM